MKILKILLNFLLFCSISHNVGVNTYDAVDNTQ